MRHDTFVAVAPALTSSTFFAVGCITCVFLCRDLAAALGQNTIKNDFESLYPQIPFGHLRYSTLCLFEGFFKGIGVHVRLPPCVFFARQVEADVRITLVRKSVRAPFLSAFDIPR